MNRPLLYASLLLLLLAPPGMAQGTQPPTQDAIMRALRTSNDTAALTKEFLRAAAIVRDSSLYAVAAEIAADPTASPEARVASLGVLYTYEQEGYSMPYGELASGACTSLGRGVDSRPYSATPLPTDHQARTLQLATTLAQDPATPLIVRNATNCIQLAEEIRILSTPIDVSLVHLVYVCGNKFIVRNGNPRVVTFEYRVVGTTEELDSQGVMARPAGQPYGERVLWTQHAGTVELLYNGQVIQTVANGGTPCPP